jgi:hypothetical protein
MKVKYPRTLHLPWSESVQSDDKVIKSTEHFNNRRVIVTEKMDGENTTMYNDHIHARSIDSKNHPSRDWVKQFHSSFKHDIPDGYRVCGENLYAKHSVKYDNLASYFYGFSIWDDQTCLDWDSTVNWFDLLGVTPVPVLYDDIWDEKLIKSLYTKDDHSTKEGYVVRLASSFKYDDFSNSVAKFVRCNHVQTDKHWMYSEIVPNTLQLV